MRPLPGDEALAGRSRNNSLESVTTPLARQTQPQMTYFMADKRTMEENLDRAAQNPASRHLREHMKRNCVNFGVESIQSISSNVQHDSDEERAEMSRKRWKQGLMKKKVSDEDMLSAYSPSQKSSIGDESRNVSPSVGRRRPSHDNLPSQPETPYYLESPMLGSTSSFLRSRRASEADFLTDESQAILSDGDDEVANSPKTMEQDSSSQFVMPSITMPTRRPFTEKGKSLGRLKIMVAGDSGVGKTSLIDSIVQSSADIVHIDPFSTTPMTASQTQRRKPRRRSTAQNEPVSVSSTSKITEVFASTRPYPSWWSEAEEIKVSRRRKSSVGDTVLDRNICFVDTPGYGSGASCLSAISPVMDYIELQYRRTVKADLSDSELAGMLSGGGGPQVDVVLYLFNQKLKPVDIEYFARLSRLTSVIPVITHADTLSKVELENFKAQVGSELKTANIRLPNLRISSPGSLGTVYAVSSALTRDDEVMDASILMSPDYKQPLISSELSTLVEQLFDPEVMRYLRHIAALKCIRYLKDSTAASIVGNDIPLSPSEPGVEYGALQVLRPPGIGPTSCHAFARIADHTQREESLARVRLSNWAIDLQRSQANERARFAAMTRQEQVIWHVDALGELVRDDALTAFPQLEDTASRPSSQIGQVVKHGHTQTHYPPMYGKQANHDPLRLLHFNEELISKTWAAVQIVSSVGVIGAVAFWFARHWRGQDGLAFGLTGLVGDW